MKRLKRWHLDSQATWKKSMIITSVADFPNMYPRRLTRDMPLLLHLAQSSHTSHTSIAHLEIEIEGSRRRGRSWFLVPVREATQIPSTEYEGCARCSC